MRRLYALVFGVVLSLSAIAPAVAKDHPVGGLDMYSTTVDAATAGRLASAGYVIVDQQINADGKVRLSIVLSGPERAQLRREGVTTDLIRDAKGRTSRQRAAAQATAGFNVWRSWDQTGGIRDELYDIAQKNAGFVKLVERLDKGTWSATTPQAMLAAAADIDAKSDLDLGPARFIASERLAPSASRGTPMKSRRR
jgi:hypothetical protein